MKKDLNYFYTKYRSGFNKKLEDEIIAKGSTFCKVYRLYQEQQENKSDRLDINDAVWDRDVNDLITCFRQNGIEEFTFSSTYSRAIETAWLFQKAGCSLEGLIEITAYDEQKPAYLFKLN